MASTTGFLLLSPANAPGSNYEARRLEYFRKTGAQRKAEHDRQGPQVNQPRQSPAPAFDAASPPPSHNPTKAPSPESNKSPVSNYEARKAA